MEHKIKRCIKRGTQNACGPSTSSVQSCAGCRRLQTSSTSTRLPCNHILCTICTENSIKSMASEVSCPLCDLTTAAQKDSSLDLYLDFMEVHSDNSSESDDGYNSTIVFDLMSEGRDHDTDSVEDLDPCVDYFEDGLTSSPFRLRRDCEGAHGPACELCDEAIAIMECADCEQKLCVKCREKHQQDMRTYHHTLFVLPEDQQFGIRDFSGTPTVRPTPSCKQKIQWENSHTCQSNMCVKHPDMSANLYCQVCSMQICFMCKASSHIGHDFTTVHSAAIQAKGSATRYVDLLKEKISISDTRLKELEDHKSGLIGKFDHIREELSQRREHLHNTIDLWYFDCSMKVDTSYSREFHKLDRQQEQAHHELKSCQEAIIKLEQTLDAAHDGEISILLANSENCLQQAKKALATCSAGRLDSMCFVSLLGQDISPEELGTVCVAPIQLRAHKSICVNSGKLLSSFTTCDEDQYVEQCQRASGLTVTKSDDIVVADVGQDQVCMFDSTGRKKCILDTYPAFEDQPTKPVAIVSQDQELIAVSCKAAVKIFHKDGSLHSQLDQQFNSPQGLAFSSSGHLIVSDASSHGHCIHILAGGDFRTLASIVGGVRAPNFHQPWYVASDRHHNIIISDYDEHKIKIFSPKGELLHEIGNKGASAGQFFHPAGVITDSYGHILVADSANDRIQMFSETGEFLGIIISQDMDSYLSAPTDIALNSQDQLVVLCENGNVRTYQYIF